MANARPLLFVSAMAFLGFSIATTQPNQAAQDKNAEDVYKNIKSFKGQKAKEIMPAMHAMSQALGTDCAHCHEGQNFASDDLRPKETAREMVELTKELNDKYFGGRPEVTCFTCHHGQGHPDGTASPFPVAPRLRSGGSASADPVLAAFAAATKTPSALTHIKLVGTVDDKGESRELTAYQSSTGKFNEVDKGKYTIGYDLKEAWVDAGAGKFVVPAPDNEALIRYGRTYWSGLPKLTQATSASEPVDGKPMKVVKGTLGGSTVKFFFDPSTALLTRIVYFDRSIVGPMNDVYDYADYKSVGGTMVPMTVTHHESATKKVVRHYTSAAVESGLDEKTYAGH